jgi:hypothetical protein
MSEPRLDSPVDYTLEQFGAEGFTYGSVIPKSWFDSRLGIPVPQTVADVQKCQILYASLMGELRAKLLVNRKMALRTKSGVGQEVVHPNEQTEWAMSEVKNGIARELEKAKDRLCFVNMTELSDEERRENMDAQAKLSFFQRKSLRSLT